MRLKICDFSYRSVNLHKQTLQTKGTPNMNRTHTQKTYQSNHIEEARNKTYESERMHFLHFFFHLMVVFSECLDIISNLHRLFTLFFHFFVYLKKKQTR